MSGTPSTNNTLFTLGAIAAISIIANGIYVWKLHDSNEKKALQIQSLKDDLIRQTELRKTERTSRISAQQKEREIIIKEQYNDGFNFPPIGYIESPFPERRGTPRQPILVPAAKGRIRFNKQLIQFEHYEELKLFSHVWVVFIFHDNTNSEKLKKIAKIKPPRLGAKVGCLSTRSPHRPNNIGLSVCEVVNVTKDYIDIAGVDMVDGTPILDVKPYIPYDMVPSDYVLPMATNAAGVQLQSRKLSVPDWVVDSDIVMQPVRFSSDALSGIEAAVLERKLKHYHSAEDMVEFITQVLRQDIRGVHQGRGTLVDLSGSGSATANTGTKDNSNSKNKEDRTSRESSVYSCTLDHLNLEFITTVSGIEVISAKCA